MIGIDGVLYVRVTDPVLSPLCSHCGMAFPVQHYLWLRRFCPILYRPPRAHLSLSLALVYLVLVQIFMQVLFLQQLASYGVDNPIFAVGFASPLAVPLPLVFYSVLRSCRQRSWHKRRCVLSWVRFRSTRPLRYEAYLRAFLLALLTRVIP